MSRPQVGILLAAVVTLTGYGWPVVALVGVASYVSGVYGTQGSILSGVLLASRSVAVLTMLAVVLAVVGYGLIVELGVGAVSSGMIVFFVGLLLWTQPNRLQKGGETA